MRGKTTPQIRTRMSISRIPTNTQTPPPPKAPVGPPHRGDVVAGHPSVDVGAGEGMPEISGSWPLTGHGLGLCGLVPDGGEYLPDCCRAGQVAGSGDQGRATRGEMRSRGPVAGVEGLDDLISRRQPAAAIAFGPDDVDVPGIGVEPHRSALSSASGSTLPPRR